MKPNYDHAFEGRKEGRNEVEEKRREEERKTPTKKKKKQNKKKEKKKKKTHFMRILTRSTPECS